MLRMPSPADAISAFFDTYGWHFERREPAVFRTGFLGETGQYDIWLRVTDAWVYFAISPYVPRSDDRAHGEGVLEALLRANHELNLAKFAVDEDGDVLLSVELPLEGFGYTQFSDALTALSHYADSYRGRLDDAAQADLQRIV